MYALHSCASLYFLKAGVLLNTIETLQIHNVTLNGDHLTNGILPLVMGERKKASWCRNTKHGQDLHTS